MRRRIVNLSKSQYLKGLQCHKRLWLSKHKPELAVPISEAQQFIFDQGTSVGKVARDLFPGGIEIEFQLNDFPGMISRTKEILNSTELVPIYEATFNYEGSFAMVDILVPTKAGVEIYEAKSGTKAKEVNISDLAFQVYVLQGLGYKVSKAVLVYINNDYVRGEELDRQELFVIVDLTDEIPELVEPIKYRVNEMAKILKAPEPDIDIGPYCNKPYECEFKGHCWSHIPEVSVFNLFDARGKDWELYRKGIIEFKDIPLNSQLSPKHRQQVESYLKQEVHIDYKPIKNFLDVIEYPISFLDFETYQEAIPSHAGMRCYQQVPFQFSLHILESPDTELVHKEFLAELDLDPRKAFVHNLLAVLPKQGSIVVYNRSFEAGVLGKLAKLFPEYEIAIDYAVNRFVDLMQVFKARWYYHWQFQGSYSIKNVLPVLVPLMNHKDLDISDGASAARAYSRLGSVGNDDTDQTMRDLLEYCRLDTLAMVEIWKVLDEVINER